jgi:hypothetical protein
MSKVTGLEMIRKQLKATELSAITFVRDYVQLSFDGPGFNALTPITVSSSQGTVVSGEDQFRNRLCGQIGKTVTEVIIEHHQALVIAFADESTISLSLKEEHYPGPEAVIFSGSDKTFVVI